MFYYSLYWSEQLRVAPAIELTDEQEGELTRLARSKRTSVRLAQRAQIVLLAANGKREQGIAMLRKAASLAPGNAAIKRHLADAEAT